MPIKQKWIEAKTKLALQGKQCSSVQPSNSSRIPPNQKEVNNFPVLDLGIRPKIAQNEWSMSIDGLVNTPICLDWDSLMQLSTVVQKIDFHCVTHWSQLDMEWMGVPLQSVIEVAKPKVEARYAMIYGYDGYSTNLSLQALMEPDVLIAFAYANETLTVEHGGPVRLLVPSRYGWKSAKWLKGITLLSQDEPGFWEERGYHMNADPFLEQRFSK